MKNHKKKTNIQSTTVQMKLMAGISRIEFREHRRWNTLQHLLGEDSQQLPTDVERLVYAAVFVVALCDEILFEFRQEFQVEEIVGC